MKDSSTKKKGTWKAIVGILLIIGAFGSLKENFGTFLFGLALGLALLIWYFWPVIRNHLKAYQLRENEKQMEEDRRKQEEEQKNAEWHVCDSCGARFQGVKCPYCRTPAGEH